MNFLGIKLNFFIILSRENACLLIIKLTIIQKIPFKTCSSSHVYSTEIERLYWIIRILWALLLKFQIVKDFKKVNGNVIATNKIIASWYFFLYSFVDIILCQFANNNFLRNFYILYEIKMMSSSVHVHMHALTNSLDFILLWFFHKLMFIIKSIQKDFFVAMLLWK